MEFRRANSNDVNEFDNIIRNVLNRFGNVYF